jgi:hypothetical protein
VVLYSGLELPCTFSAGVTEARRMMTAAPIMRRANQALYAAKEEGRNRTGSTPKEHAEDADHLMACIRPGSLILALLVIDQNVEDPVRRMEGECLTRRRPSQTSDLPCDGRHVYPICVQ